MGDQAVKTGYERGWKAMKIVGKSFFQKVNQFSFFAPAACVQRGGEARQDDGNATGFVAPGGVIALFKI
ncbi:hypothetical protein DZA28_16960 [Pseudomonas alloputida]|uniref:Uncharacterized protein n=3 Tax=Pseudomonas TaxID=286 RepID=A0ABD6N1F8_9PSED|nr:hypothetical protein [Pseudomonas hunanensis]PTV60109.1 hypothetical protein DBL03_12820 [Pseudomonas putida]TRZ61541.1 hypothetical protein DZA28_16960 [Pseudomonas alloputida]